MSDTHERRYDEDDQTMWVFYDFDEPKTLVPNDELRTWIKALKKGETPDGEPLKSVCYVLADEASASYNHQALAYANIDVFTGSIDDPTPFEPEGETPDFDTRSDFGIDD